MNSNRIIIIGGGGHAKVLIDSISSTGIYQIEGIVDNQLKADEKVLGIPVLGGDEFLDRNVDYKDNSCLAIGIGTVKATDKRKIIYEKYQRQGFKFPTIIHNKAYVAKSAKCRDGTQIMAGAIVSPEVEVGENVVIYSAAVIEHDCKIASHCYISPGALLGGQVQIGANSFIGIGACILQGIKIGTQVTVGAGAVVISDVEDGRLVAGIPAREINK